MHDSSELTLAIIGAVMTWTVTVVGCMIWLTGKFRSVEVAIYKESKEIQATMYRLDTRIQRLEIKVFGYGPVEFGEEAGKD